MIIQKIKPIVKETPTKPAETNILKNSKLSDIPHIPAALPKSGRKDIHVVLKSKNPSSLESSLEQNFLKTLNFGKVSGGLDNLVEIIEKNVPKDQETPQRLSFNNKQINTITNLVTITLCGIALLILLIPPSKMKETKTPDNKTKVIQIHPNKNK